MYKYKEVIHPMTKRKQYKIYKPTQVINNPIKRVGNNAISTLLHPSHHISVYLTYNGLLFPLLAIMLLQQQKPLIRAYFALFPILPPPATQHTKRKGK